MPRYVRVTEQLPSTATQKVLKRVLRAEHWACDDPVWWRAERGAGFRELTPDDAAQLRSGLEARGRAHLVGRG